MVLTCERLDGRCYTKASREVVARMFLGRRKTSDSKCEDGEQKKGSGRDLESSRTATLSRFRWVRFGEVTHRATRNLGGPRVKYDGVHRGCRGTGVCHFWVRCEYVLFMECPSPMHIC